MTKASKKGVWSRVKKEQVHEDLQKLIDLLAIELFAQKPELGIIVTEGARSHERQRTLKAAGASRTLRSRHIAELQPSFKAEAVDIAVTVNGEVRWDWPLYEGVARLAKQIAKQHGIKLTWGGDWPRFRDGPHFEL